MTRDLSQLRTLRRHRRGVPPFLFAHRGLSFQAPEDSLSSWTLAAKAGHGLEGDFRRSSDGVQFCLHDTTLDRTTTSAGAMNAQNAAFLDAVDNGSKYGVGYVNEKLPRLSAMLAVASQYNVWCLPECEDLTLAAAQQIAGQVYAAGLQDRTIMQMFEVTPYPVLSAIRQQFPAMEVICLFNTGAGAPGIANLKAAGINYVGVDINSAFVNKAWVDSMRAAGIRTACYTIDDSASRALALAAGFDHWFTGRANLWIRGTPTPGPSVETWKGDAKWMWGDDWLLDTMTQQTATGCRPNNGDCGLDLTTLLNAGAVNIGRPLPLATKNYTVDFSVKLTLANADATRWSALQFGLQQDTLIKNFAACDGNGYACVIRQNGTFSLDKYVGGAGSVAMVSDATSAALVVGQATPFRLTVTPTQLTLQRLDNGKQVTVADNAFRGGKYGLIWSNQASRYLPITVAEF